MHMYHFGTNLELERMVSKTVLDQVAINYQNCFIIAAVLIVILLVPYIIKKNKLYLCFMLAPVLAMAWLQGTYMRYYRSLARGYVEYEFVTVSSDKNIVNSIGDSVSINIANCNEGEVYVVTNTKLKPQKLTQEEQERYHTIVLTGGLE